ncbi:RluA family pseudouridine synthase [Gammaproteobacteria bacterium]|nr:RluA family pseudouridine synthase [Gammaproteobacteria bacterium]
MENKKKISLNYIALPADQGQRVDQITAKQFPDYSRAHIQRWIKDGDLLVNSKEVKSKYIMQTDDAVSVNFLEESQLVDLPEDIALDVIFEDAEILIINKPAGLVVHPGSGNRTGTLVNALLAHDENLSFLPRAGIVHRLDKDTSGLMVISKTESSYLNLVEQLKERSVTRTYLAMVVGVPVINKTINQPIGRHPKIRTKQAVNQNGKEAITRFSILENLDGYSLLKVNLETGRTHQIRVHLSHIGFPIIGDPLYGSRNKFSRGSSEELKIIISNFKRQALHAEELQLNHPSSGELLSFKASMPSDMQTLLNQIKVNGS